MLKDKEQRLQMPPKNVHHPTVRSTCAHVDAGQHSAEPLSETGVEITQEERAEILRLKRQLRTHLQQQKAVEEQLEVTCAQPQVIDLDTPPAVSATCPVLDFSTPEGLEKAAPFIEPILNELSELSDKTRTVFDVNGCPGYTVTVTKISVCIAKIDPITGRTTKLYGTQVSVKDPSPQHPPPAPRVHCLSQGFNYEEYKRAKTGKPFLTR